VRVLGLSALYHDSAAALIEDGHVLAAAQEERFTRKKHDARFPSDAIGYCLREFGGTLDQVDFVVFYDKPFLKFERLLETYLAFAPRGFSSFRMALPLWLKEKLFQKQLLKNELRRFAANFDVERKVLFSEHHLSHAASAFYPSPFREAAILTMDGVGEWATTSLAMGNENGLSILREIHYPHSLGMLYSAFTYYTGFRVNSGEYKIMGLAPYGTPKYAQLILDHLIDLKPDGTFRLNMSYFDFCVGLAMTNSRFNTIFGGPPRAPETPLTQREMDLAASVQAVLEEAVLRLTRSIAAETRMPNLCMAGGVALNCVVNGKVLRDGSFKNLWIQPAAGDAGGAIGAALAAYHLFNERPRVLNGEPDGMKGAFLGPSYSTEEVARTLQQLGAEYQTLSDSALIDATAKAIADGKAVGWFQGRMEFGPRALGARSILADARSPQMQSVLNLKVKYRESFRPFAPSVLREHVAEWFDLDNDSPYMMLVAPVASDRCRQMSQGERGLFGIAKLNVTRSDIPAVTHVDYTARVQTVHPDTNHRYHTLLTRFYELTGCPVLVNTSFNVRGEPIVCDPEDAYRCFMGTNIDALAIANCWLEKSRQPEDLRLQYHHSFDLD
jgi:carbamoyltransferase